MAYRLHAIETIKKFGLCAFARDIYTIEMREKKSFLPDLGFKKETKHYGNAPDLFASTKEISN